MLILIVEDNAVLAFMMEHALTGAGHRVLGPASDPVEAIGLADQFRPELAIVDIDLKDHASGIEIARNLRVDRGIPSLFSTGQVETARRHADVAIGILSKPFAPETVVNAVAVVSKLLAREELGELPRELELFRKPSADGV